MMIEPSWYPRVRPHPDYEMARMIVVDTNIISRAAVREQWDDTLSFVFNSPPQKLRLKINAQVLNEALGAGSDSMDPRRAAQQRSFIMAYRLSGKILVEDAFVPFFARSRQMRFDAVQPVLAATNLSVADSRVAADAIVNAIPLLSGDLRMREGLRKALANAAVIKMLKDYKLVGGFDQIVLPYP